MTSVHTTTIWLPLYGYYEETEYGYPTVREGWFEDEESCRAMCNDMNASTLFNYNTYMASVDKTNEHDDIAFEEAMIDYEILVSFGREPVVPVRKAKLGYLSFERWSRSNGIKIFMPIKVKKYVSKP